MSAATSDAKKLEEDDELREELILKQALILSSSESTISQRHSALAESLKLLKDGTISNVGMAHLVFGCIQLQALLRTSDVDEKRQKDMNDSLNEVLTAICRIRRVSTIVRLVADQLANIAGLCNDVIDKDYKRDDTESKTVAPVCTALSIAVQTALDRKGGAPTARPRMNGHTLDAVIGTLFRVLGDGRADVRVNALETLSILTADMKMMELLREQRIRQLLGVHLPSSLLWVDEQSVAHGIPILISLSSYLLQLTTQSRNPPALQSSAVPHEWQVAFKCLLKTNGMLIEKAVRQSDPASQASLLVTSAMIFSFLPDMAGHRLLPHVANVLTLGTKLLSVTFTSEAVTILSDAICSCLSIGWPLFKVANHAMDSAGHVLSRRVFMAAIACVMNAHRHKLNRATLSDGNGDDEEERKIIIRRCEQCAKNIIARLFVTNQEHTIRLLQLTEERALKYPSLEPALTFARDIRAHLNNQVKAKAEEEQRKNRGGADYDEEYGFLTQPWKQSVIGQFFSEIR